MGSTAIFSIIAILLVLPSFIGYLQENVGYSNITGEFANAQPLRTENNQITTQLSSKGNATTNTCIDNQTGFSINYNRNWSRYPNKCIYFSPLSVDIFSL